MNRIVIGTLFLILFVIILIFLIRFLFGGDGSNLGIKLPNAYPIFPILEFDSGPKPIIEDDVENEETKGVIEETIDSSTIIEERVPIKNVDRAPDAPSFKQVNLPPIKEIFLNTQVKINEKPELAVKNTDSEDEEEIIKKNEERRGELNSIASIMLTIGDVDTGIYSAGNLEKNTEEESIENVTKYMSGLSSHYMSISKDLEKIGTPYAKKMSNTFKNVAEIYLKFTNKESVEESEAVFVFNSFHVEINGFYSRLINEIALFEKNDPAYYFVGI